MTPNLTLAQTYNRLHFNYSYTGLGYTGIRTYRTENFSPAEAAHSMFCTVWYSDIPDSKS